MAQPNRQTSPAKTQRSFRASSKNDEVFQVLQEMFQGKVDPEVVHMILTEMDWKVDKAIDTLLTFCGESADVDRKKGRLYKIAQDILCKKTEESTTNSSHVQKDLSSIGINSGRQETQLARSHETKDDAIRKSKSPESRSHAVPSNTLLERREERHKISTRVSSESPLQRIRNVMASTYGTQKEPPQEVEDKREINDKPTVNPMSVDDDVTTDNNLLSQSILSGALNLSSSNSQPEVSVLSPSKMYTPFQNTPSSGLPEDSQQKYLDKYWPSLSGKMWPGNDGSVRERDQNKESGSTNIFPGMYTDNGERKSGTNQYSRPKESENLTAKHIQRSMNYSPSGIRNIKTSLLERLGIAEKNEKGQLKNLQKDPEEDLDLNFSMETFDLENDDSSSEGSLLSQSGSAETMTAELKNMLGLSKEEKKEPTMLESAARELERLNALSPNAKEFVPRSSSVETSRESPRSSLVETSVVDTQQTEAIPKFLTPKCALTGQPRNLPPYTIVPQPLQMRPMSVYPVPPHIPFSPQIVPVSLVGLRNVPPPPPMNILSSTNHIGTVIQPPPPNILRPPPMVPVSSPSPPVLPYAAVATSPSVYPHTTAQQLATEAQQYATAAAQQLARQAQSQKKELSSSPEASPDPNTQVVKDKIKNDVKLLIILRGLPGSGKSTLARELKGKGMVFSADDHFMNGDVYCYDQRKLSEAHDQCRKRALDAVLNGVTPVIIDNTNTQVWEMCPYVDIAMSVSPAYEIEILEPSTPWKFKARTLAEKSEHAVPYDSIKRMLDRYQRNVTVEMLVSTKSKSRPGKTKLKTSNEESASQKTKKPVETKNKAVEYNVEDNEDIWQDVGSISWKNYYQPLMDDNEVEGKDDDVPSTSDFPELKTDRRKDSEKENNLPNQKEKAKKNKDSPKHGAEKQKRRKRKKENFQENETNDDAKGPAEIAESNATENKLPLTTTNLENRNGNFIPMTAGLGLRIKPQKSLFSLQKQVELISQQKTLVSSNTAASPITVQLEHSAENVVEQRTSRTSSFEKAPAEDRNFSDEIHELVDGLISEHVQDKRFTNEDFDKVQEELKAFLHIMPIDEKQRQDAECLIEHKLNLFLIDGRLADTAVEQMVEVRESHPPLLEKCTNTTTITEIDNSESLSNSEKVDFVDGFYIVNSDDPSCVDLESDAINENISAEDNMLKSSEKDSLTIGAEIEDISTTSLELSLEKVFNKADNSDHIVEEKYILHEAKTSDLSVEESNTSDIQGQGQGSNLQDLASEKSNDEKLQQDHEDIVTKQFEKEYWKNQDSVTCNTKQNLFSEFNSENERPSTENISDDIDLDNFDEMSDQCLGENFWELDKDTEKDAETSYWENGEKKHLNEADNQELKSPVESDCPSTPNDDAIGTSPTVWDEPKSRRQRKRSNRDKRGRNENNSNNNSLSEDSGQIKSDLGENLNRSDSNFNNKILFTETPSNEQQSCSQTELDTDDKPDTAISINGQLDSDLPSSAVNDSNHNSSINIQGIKAEATSGSDKSVSQITSPVKRKPFKEDFTIVHSSFKTSESDFKAFQSKSTEVSTLISSTISYSYDKKHKLSTPLKLISTDQKISIKSDPLETSVNSASDTFTTPVNSASDTSDTPVNSVSDTSDLGSSSSDTPDKQNCKSNISDSCIGVTSDMVAESEEKANLQSESEKNQNVSKINQKEKLDKQSVSQTVKLSSLSGTTFQDTSSFVVKHYEQFSCNSSQTIPSSLMPLKKGREYLTIDSDTVQSRLRGENNKTKEELRATSGDKLDPSGNENASLEEFKTEDNCNESHIGMTVNNEISEAEDIKFDNIDNIGLKVNNDCIDNDTKSNTNNSSHNNKNLSIADDLEQSYSKTEHLVKAVNKSSTQAVYDSLVQSGIESPISTDNNLDNCLPKEGIESNTSETKLNDINDEKTLDVKERTKTDCSQAGITPETGLNDKNSGADKPTPETGLNDNSSGAAKATPETGLNDKNSAAAKATPETGLNDKNSGAKKKKKANSKRKMAAKFPEKFLDDSVKEAFLNNDWATQMPKLEGSAPLTTCTSPEHSIERVNSKLKVDNSTSITSDDLKVLHSVNQGFYDILKEFDYPYSVAIGQDKSTSKYDVNISNPEEKSAGVPVVLHPDKSTMTENMCVVGLEFLHSSFPYIQEKELKDILERCDGDVEWAVNLLLDWKYHLQLTDEESDRFVDGIFKAQHIPKSPVIHPYWRQKSFSSETAPATLQDMCFSVVSKEHNVNRQEIEQLLIVSSEKRLKSLEKQFSTQAKQYSFSSFGDEIIEDDSEFTEALLKELINSAENKSLSSESHESSQLSLLDDLPNDSVQISNGGLDIEDPNEFWNVELDLGARRKQVEGTTDLINSDLEGSDDDMEQRPSDMVPEISEAEGTERDRTESFGEPTLALPLKKEFTKALFSLFGPIEGIDTDKGDDLTIPVTLDMAKLMYTCIKTASNKGLISIQSDQQLLEDEAYARQLQAEENDRRNNMPGPVNSTPRLSSKRPQHVVGLNIDNTLNMLTKIPKVVSLAEIMQEETVKENEKRELVETLRQSGSYTAMSTRLKQHKLYDQFPGIDQTVLDDIYHANCCNLEETVKAIEHSLACNTGTPKTVMSKEAEYVYEKHLIDAAKQQSLQEMLDSYFYVRTPKIVREVQAVSSTVDYDEVRGEANLHYKLRHECFQKAQEAHRKGMKQVATFYAEQARSHTKKIKDANMRASEQILATRHDMLEKNSTLDLHGLHVDEAVAALERILPNREFELQSNPLKHQRYLIVITGRGSHSRGGVSRLKPAVINYLRKNEYRYSEVHEGALRVNIKHK